MTAPESDAACDAIGRVEALAAAKLSETIYAAPAAAGSWWFWWSWADRIAPIGDVETAAFKIAYVLTPTS
jgi:hypothetical protein